MLNRGYKMSVDKDKDKDKDNFDYQAALNNLSDHKKPLGHHYHYV